MRPISQPCFVLLFKFNEKLVLLCSQWMSSRFYQSGRSKILSWHENRVARQIFHRVWIASKNRQWAAPLFSRVELIKVSKITFHGRSMQRLTWRLPYFRRCLPGVIANTSDVQVVTPHPEWSTAFLQTKPSQRLGDIPAICFFTFNIDNTKWYVYV